MKKPHLGLLALLMLITGIPSFSQDGGPFNFYINFAGAYQLGNGDENGVTAPNAAFKGRYLRMECKGSIGDNLYYRFRQDLNSGFRKGSLDGMGKSINMMYVGYKWNEHFAVEAGKTCQHWGGFDYDENPLYIYQYSDYVDHLDIFFMGVDFYWRPSPKHEFVFELTNPSSDLLPVKYPLNALINWNANLLDGTVQLRCAVGGMTQAEGLWGKLINGGIRFSYPKFQWYVDTMFEKDGVDRVGIATADLGAAALESLGETLYNSNIVKCFWQFAPGWNLVAKGSWDGVYTDGGGHYRDGLMGLCCLEYYPVEGQDLRFFAALTGHRVIFHGAGLPDSFNAGRAEVGLIYRIKVH